jgi:uncharacterized membrane protein (UPF0127 family)
MFRAFLISTLLLSACSPAEEEAQNVATAPASALLPLAIRTDKGDHRFAVEVAATPQEQEKGLMFRKELGAGTGMIFPMAPPRTASFWMKDTLIPLDILFIRTDGSIALVAANTTPYSREPVSAGIPVAAVLELRGGRAAELGIEEGDKVRWGSCAAADGKPAAFKFCPAQ